MESGNWASGQDCEPSYVQVNPSNQASHNKPHPEVVLSGYRSVWREACLRHVRITCRAAICCPGVRCIKSFVSKRKKRGYEFRDLLGNYTMKRTNPPNSYPRFLRLRNVTFYTTHPSFDGNMETCSSVLRFSPRACNHGKHCTAFIPGAPPGLHMEKITTIFNPGRAPCSINFSVCHGICRFYSPSVLSFLVLFLPRLPPYPLSL